MSLDFLNNQYYYIRYVDKDKNEHYVRIKNKKATIKRYIEKLKNEGCEII